MSAHPPVGPRWTPDEDHVLRLHYRAYGSDRVQRVLAKHGSDRSVAAIWKRARRLKIDYDPTRQQTLMPLGEARFRVRFDHGRPLRQAHHDIIEAAERDGVLTRARLYPYMHMAPVEWVDEYMERFERELEEDLETARTWLQTEEVAGLFGIATRSLQVLISPNCNKPYSIHTHLRRIPVRRLRHAHAVNASKGRYWEPASSKLEARLYSVRQQRRTVKLHQERQAKRALP